MSALPRRRRPPSWVDLLLAENRFKFCGTVNKEGHSFRKRGALPVVKTKTCLWYFCGQRRNRRGKNHGNFHFGTSQHIDNNSVQSQIEASAADSKPAFWPAAPLRRTSVFAFGENLGAGAALLPRALKYRRVEPPSGRRNPKRKTRRKSCLSFWWT